MSVLTLCDGVAYWGDSPFYLVTAEYPYFRDTPERWEQNLRQLLDLGVRVVSTYIPWRHHELNAGGQRRFDFTGETQPNRDVRGFIRLCHSLGLQLMIKPGPFCHAELNYGALPDFVCPLQRPDIEATLNAEGEAVLWSGSEPQSDGSPALWPLPSADSPAYKADVARWFDAVREQVLRDNCAPLGPVVALKVGNEGIYSDAQHAILAHDYSAASLNEYRLWVQTRYGSIAAYNDAHSTVITEWSAIAPPRRYTPPAELRGLAAYTDWPEYAGYRLGALYSGYACRLDLPVPVLVNVNPPTGDAWGIDAWLSRVQPHQWHDVHYGYTNWIGVAAEDPSALARYMLLTRRAPGPNVEENWGFGLLYDPRYEYASVCFQQTLVAIAGGATGYNIYTAIGTDAWDAEIDRFQTRPYPSHAPIAPQGNDVQKTAVLAQLNGFLAEYGAEYMACPPATEVAWGIYQPYAHTGAWTAGLPDAQREVAGHRLSEQGPAILACQQVLAKDGIDLAFADLQRTTLTELSAYKLLFVATGPSMDAHTQQLLVDYVREGGQVVLIGEIPTLDEKFQACAILFTLRDPNVVSFANVTHALSALPQTLAPAHLNRLAVSGAGVTYTWLRTHPTKDIHYIVLVSRTAGEIHLTYTHAEQGYEVHLVLAARGGAIMRLEDGQLTAAVFADDEGSSIFPHLDDEIQT